MLTGENWFVVGMGIGIVFLGLICIVILCKIVSAFCKGTNKEIAEKNVISPTIEKPIENRQEIIAAVSAAVAEELGTNISAIRILSFKKI